MFCTVSLPLEPPLTPLSGFEPWLELREQLMDCEMFPMLQQQQELMSQSPPETTQAARNSDRGVRIKGEESVPGYLDVSERPFLSA